METLNLNSLFFTIWLYYKRVKYMQVLSYGICGGVNLLYVLNHELEYKFFLNIYSGQQSQTHSKKRYIQYNSHSGFYCH